jgi:hypothetical protein
MQDDPRGKPDSLAGFSGAVRRALWGWLICGGLIQIPWGRVSDGHPGG